MSPDLSHIGSRIRELREICGILEETLATELDISLETYRRYEQEGGDIPISVLYHLSQRMGVDLPELLTGQEARLSTYSVVRQGQGDNVVRHPGYAYSGLATTYKDKIMEPLLVTVEPSGDDPQLVVHKGQEFNLILQGSIELLFGEKRILLNEGDCVYFNPTYPHGQKAVGGPAQFLTVITEK